MRLTLDDNWTATVTGDPLRSTPRFDFRGHSRADHTARAAKNPRDRSLTWGLKEPPSGFEPETYALRVRCSGHLS